MSSPDGRRLRRPRPTAARAHPVITIVIADDQERVREGLRMMLDAEPDLTVVGEAGGGEEALAAARNHKPDVLLMDIRMPDLDGIEATRRLVAAGGRARVLILTTFDLDEYVYQAMKAGASGFLVRPRREGRPWAAGVCRSLRSVAA
jgi:DNA-binding NarL/FixJ family response regulator